jgi:hypothetical protein
MAHAMRRSAAATAVVLFLLAAFGAADSAAAGWSETRLPGPAGELFLLNVSCPTASFCVASGSQNLIASSTDPTGGPGAWNVVYAGEGRYDTSAGPSVPANGLVQGISCPSSRLCVAVTNQGDIYATTDPTGPASAWSVSEPKPSGRNIHLYGISCPTESLCVAVSGRRVNTGKVFTSTDPTGGVGAWQETDLGEGFDLRAVSCGSARLCVAAGADGEILASTDPTGGPGAWTDVGAPGGPAGLQAIDCVAGACLAGDAGGDLLAAAEPAELSSWHAAPGGGSVRITGAACASPSACLAVDDNGRLIVSTDPTGADPDWTGAEVRPFGAYEERTGTGERNGLFGASCPAIDLCALVGSGGAILTSTEPFAPPGAVTTAGGRPGAGAGGRRRTKRPRVRFARFEVRTPHERFGSDPHRARVFMRFYAPVGPVRRYECRLDRGRWRRCRSPKRYPKVGHGMHRVGVRAVGFTGLRGRPTVWRFYVGRYCVHRSCLSVAEFPPKHQPAP